MLSACVRWSHGYYPDPSCDTQKFDSYCAYKANIRSELGSTLISFNINSEKTLKTNSQLRFYVLTVVLISNIDVIFMNFFYCWHLFEVIWSTLVIYYLIFFVWLQNYCPLHVSLSIRYSWLFNGWMLIFSNFSFSNQAWIKTDLSLSNSNSTDRINTRFITGHIASLLSKVRLALNTFSMEK